MGSNLVSSFESNFRLPLLEKLRGGGKGGGGETIEEPKEEEKMGDGIKGGNPLEDSGSGDVMGTVVGETRGEAIKNRHFRVS